MEKNETYGELKRRYPNVWREWHGKMSGHAKPVAERNTLLRITAENLGRRLGWQATDTAEFAETLRAVGDATSGDMTN